MELVVLGVSHKTASAGIRDEVQVHPDEMPAFYSYVREHDDRIRELVVLSTCNRTEFYGFARSRAEADQVFRDSMVRIKGVHHLNNGKYTYSWTGRETVQHLFRVAAGMDSLMVGESQILGQVRDAFDTADKNGSVGALLTRLFHTAVHVGKRARAETEIGRGTVSVAHAAVELALKVVDGLERYPVLVIGAGETGGLAARHFADAGPKSLTVINRTQARAVELAREIGGRARPWEDLDDALREARVIVTATGAREPIVDAERMRRGLKRSARGPKVLVDIANPRNIHPSVADLDRVFLYDLDALESVADQNRARRRAEIPKVEGIIVEEVERFLSWYESLDMVPVIRALRGRFREIAEKELRRQVKHFEPDDQVALEEFTRVLLNKLLHQPTTKIRGVEQSSRHGLHKLVAIQELFELELDLDTSEEGDAPPKRGETREPDGDAAEAGAGPSDEKEAPGTRDEREEEETEA